MAFRSEWNHPRSRLPALRPAVGADSSSCPNASDHVLATVSALPAIGILLAITVALTLISIRVFRWDDI